MPCPACRPDSTGERNTCLSPRLPPTSPSRPPGWKETAGGSSLPGCGRLLFGCARARGWAARGRFPHAPTPAGDRRGPECAALSACRAASPPPARPAVHKYSRGPEGAENAFPTRLLAVVHLSTRGTLRGEAWTPVSTALPNPRPAQPEGTSVGLGGRAWARQADTDPKWRLGEGAPLNPGLREGVLEAFQQSSER